MAKRILDILISFLGLIILSPLFLTITFLIKVLMPGAALFRQVRVGRYGNTFELYKFRTMIENHDGNTISLKGDNRITPLGSPLRKYKLDELPELWNILKGDMSLVGPRPDVPEYISKLTAEERLYLNIRPGLTSPASIKYADEEKIVAAAPDPQKYYDEVIWPDKVKLNLEYYRDRNFTGDILLILKTIFMNKKDKMRSQN